MIVKNEKLKHPRGNKKVWRYMDLPKFLDRIDVPALIEETDAASGSRGEVVDLDSLRIQGSQELRVLSPSTGVFYRTPSPSEPEYVSVGSEVAVDEVLCVLEAMKMFAPFRLTSCAGAGGALYPAEQRYRVNRINVSNGQQVNEGDLLFVIEPLAAAMSAPVPVRSAPPRVLCKMAFRSASGLFNSAPWSLVILWTSSEA